jgi:hypothetical protein
MMEAASRNEAGGSCDKDEGSLTCAAARQMDATKI